MRLVAQGISIAGIYYGISYRSRYQDLYRTGISIAFAIRSFDLSVRLIVVHSVDRAYKKWWAVPTLQMYFRFVI